MTEGSGRLGLLVELWEREREATQRKFVEERQKLSLGERVERGLALSDVVIEETDAAPGERTLLWLVLLKGGGLERFRVGPGAPVRLWWDDPDGEEVVLGTVARRRGERLGVMIEGWPSDRLLSGAFHLDRDDLQATFKRGVRALRVFRDAKESTDVGRLRGVLFEQKRAHFGEVGDWEVMDEGLNGPQREAVEHGMRALDLALVHGPPGTGKTRTLVEIIRQAVKRGEKVLATAASNTAVDNLAERLVAEGVEVVRMGHPARVSAAMESRTLDVLLEGTATYAMTRKWIMEANAIRRKVDNGRERDSMSYGERKEQLAEMRRLFRDARRQRQGMQESILTKADVICATAAGADSALMGDLEFGLVVLDEATQATDPIALVPLSRAKRAVLAGDPCQLPPTVIDLEAERGGLGETIFERLARQSEVELLRLLEIQYRMNVAIMKFPSESMYGGRLRAALEVAEHRLEELEGVQVDPLRERPFVFVDTAGKGWEERHALDDPSTSNPEQAMRVVAEVRRLLGRGVSASEVAVITPYDAQVRLLREELSEELGVGLEVGSVDGFQGREKEVIVLDLVRSNGDGAIGFLKDTRRMNVALTRARRFLLVLGDSATLGGDAYYASFLEHCEREGAWLSAWDDEAPLFD